jgi:hypothetical protein
MMQWIDELRGEGDHATRLVSDLEYFAQHLKIRPKVGPLTPLVLNPAQLELHRQIEAQRAKTGRVRIIVLKARQLGVSTYVAARLYHKTINSPGLRDHYWPREARKHQPLSDRETIPRQPAR